MIIDSNVHWLPEDLFTDEKLLNAFVNSVPCAYGETARVDCIPGSQTRQIIIEKPKGYENLNYAENQYNIKDQLKDMDEAGVEKALLRIPCFQEWLDLELCKRVNDGLAAHVKKAPDRFVALAVVPPWGTPGCIAEMERCVNELGFHGVQLAAHYGTLYLDEDEFKPYFKRLNELKVPVVVHHTPLPVAYTSIYKYTNLRRQYGRCVDQGTAVGRELFSGMFGEFPDLKLTHSMLGGGFFAYETLMLPQRSGAKEEMERFDMELDAMRGYLKNNLFFDMSGALWWGKYQLECAIKTLGADHILFGSSYPVRRELMLKGVEFVKKLDIADSEKDLVLGGNAARIFNIK